MDGVFHGVIGHFEGLLHPQGAREEPTRRPGQVPFVYKLTAILFLCAMAFSGLLTKFALIDLQNVSLGSTKYFNLILECKISKFLLDRIY